MHFAVGLHNKVQTYEWEHRFKSWEYCFNEFAQPDPNVDLPLHLAFYLASFGMYRGSSGLLQKSYKIHEEAVRIICNEKWDSLRCSANNEFEENKIGDIINLKECLSKYYKSIGYNRNGETQISPTDTLISKILLGTLGCVPAYDNYFVKGLISRNIWAGRFNRDSLIKLNEFIISNNEDIETAKRHALEFTGVFYPKMKIIDMYFWQSGFELSTQTKSP